MRMQRIVLLILAWMVVMTTAIAQVEMAVAITTQQTDLSQNTYGVLRSKLLGAITAEGVAAEEYSCIAVLPSINFTNKQLVEGGMRNITIIDMQLTLTAEHIVTGTVFHSTTLSLRGEGTSLDMAIRSAVSRMENRDRRVRQFASQARQKIIQYYQNNTNALITKAKTLAARKDYDEAMALLDAYPVSLEGYAAVSKTMTGIYKEYQTNCCQELMAKARSAYAMDDYQEAATLLAQVDMQSSCGQEAKILCMKIKQSRDAAAAQAAEAYEREWQAQANLESQRIQAAKEVAEAYYKNQTKYYFVW